MQPQPLFIIPETALRLSLRARLQRARNCGLMSKFDKIRILSYLIQVRMLYVGRLQAHLSDPDRPQTDSGVLSDSVR
jgi:hypothetical protein